MGRLNFSVLITYLLCSETHGRLKKQSIPVALAVRLVPFVRGFDCGAWAKPVIQPNGPTSFRRVAKAARIGTQVVPAKDQFEVPQEIVVEFGWPIGDLRITTIALGRQRKRAKSE